MNDNRETPLSENDADTDTPTFSSLKDVQDQAQRMQDYFLTGATLPIVSRREALMDLKSYLKEHEQEVLQALYDDLGKAPFEGYETELGIVYDEINICLKQVDAWSKPQRADTPIYLMPASSTVYPSPLGVVLVLSPWNYPLQLALAPIVDAITAGNCVALKPSRTSVYTSRMIIKIITEVFSPEFVCAFPGSDDMNNWLLETRWDEIFFTGSPRVGRTIMSAAAQTLTPVVLELGGKSPCIVDNTANILRAAQRIAWGKGINSGQTCVAPDYFLVHNDVVEELVQLLDKYFHEYYTDDILTCDEWPHMINRHHYDRVMGLINDRNPQATIAFGGNGDPETLKIEPTCLRGITLDDPVMGQEIFGPVLPIITYDTLDEAFAIIRTFEKPLATYIFSDDKKVQQRVITELAFGGATINDTIIHIANNHMGFGGVGNSGMGAYHGKVGFDCFTHYKSTVNKGTQTELNVRVPPFGDKIKTLRRFMK